jgi:hypothetical protein
MHSTAFPSGHVAAIWMCFAQGAPAMDSGTGKLISRVSAQNGMSVAHATGAAGSKLEMILCRRTTLKCRLKAIQNG